MSAKMAKGMDPLGDIPSDSDESDAEEEAHAPAPAPRPESKIDYEALRAHGMKSAPSVLGIQEKRATRAGVGVRVVAATSRATT